jgi:acetyl esterase/lipase
LKPEPAVAGTADEARMDQAASVYEIPGRRPASAEAPSSCPAPPFAPWSPVALFDFFVPHDTGVRRLARDVPFGTHARQKLDLYAPASGGEGRPLLVFFYGGGWSHGAKGHYGWAARALAAQGFVVAVPDYRLVPEVRFPTFVEDGAAAVAMARQIAALHGADPDRVALAGHSAGAYKVAMLGLDARWLARAGVDVGVVRAVAGLAGPYDFHPSEHPSAQAAFGHAADVPATQPVSFVRADAPALWLATGERDRVVRPANSVSLADKARAAGGRAEARLYPGLDHIQIMTALSRPFRGKAPVLAEMAAFLHANTN